MRSQSVERIQTNLTLFIIGLVLGGFAFMLVLSMGGCNTVKGMARDFDAMSTGMARSASE